MPGELRFLSFNKKLDWDRGWAVNLRVADPGLAINSTERYAVSRIINLDEAGMTAGITDFAVGPGMLYFLDESANLWVYDYKNQRSELFFRSGHGLFSNQAALALSGDVICLADPAGGGKVSAFSRTNGQTLWSIDEYDGNSLLPLAVASDGRNVYVLALLDCLSRDGGEYHIQQGNIFGVLKINLSGRTESLYLNEQFSLQEKISISELKYRFFITVAANGTVYALEGRAGEIYQFAAGGELQGKFAAAGGTSLSGLGIDAGNSVYIGDCRNISHEAEDDRFITRLNHLGEIEGQIAGFRGRADKLLLDARHNMFIWNGELSTITILKYSRKIMEMGASGLPRGIFYSAAIDSTVTETHWHKLILDADLPENTQLRVAYLAADLKSFLIGGKNVDLDEYIRDESIPWPEKMSNTGHLWSGPVVNPSEALLQKARGRYLWLKIEFIGSERETPLLKKIRVYFPRMSYLRYLPAVYQEDNKSRDFLERYLSLFETFFEDMEEKIDGVARYFDADAVSGDYLRWLATWLAVAVDDSWTEDQLRQLIKKSPELYKKRGTKQAIEEMVEIYTGEKPIIVEFFQIRHLKERSDLKELISRLYGLDPYCFCVMVREQCVATEQRRLTLQKLLKEEKPAYTTAKLVILQPWIYMDMHTYLGVNTYLSELSLLRLGREFSIPNNAVVIDVDMDNRLSLHSRMELDARVE